MDLTTAQLKDTIANMDADFYIIRKEYATVDGYLRDMGYFVPMKDIKSAVDTLNKDPYYTFLAKQQKA